jgi:uncharacterized protein (DUF2141 family)
LKQHHRARAPWLALFVLCLLVSGGAALHAQNRLTVTIRDNVVTAQGLTPGGGAVVFAIAQRWDERQFYYSQERVEKLVPDDDRDGTVTYEHKKAVPWRSVWVIVDLKTGAYAIASPQGENARIGKGRASRRVNGGASLEHERDAVDLLVVRPGGEVWTLAAARSAPSAKQGGAVRAVYATALDEFRPLTPDARPLTHLTGADVVVAIDPQLIEAFLVSGE